MAVGRHLRPPRRRLRPLLGRRAAGWCPTSRRCSTTRRCWCRVYLHAWQVTGEARYRQVVEETIGYVLRDLRHPEGGFYSAEDADSPRAAREEGRFYIWTPAEVAAVARRRRSRRRRSTWYGVTRGRQLRGSHHPAPARRAATCCGRRRSSGRGPLLFDGPRPAPSGPASTTRSSPSGTPSCWRPWPRPAPPLGRADWLDAAAPTPSSCSTSLRRADGRWQRSWQADGGGPPRRPRRRPRRARRRLRRAWPRPPARPAGSTRPGPCADTMLDQFWDVDNGGLFTTADDAEALIVRQKDLLDNATPSANSLAAIGLLRLAALTGEPRYRHQAEQILQLVGGVVGRRPDRPSPTCWPPSTCCGPGVTEIAVVGDRPDLVAAVQLALPAQRRAGLGRAVRLAAVAGPSPRVRLRLPRLRLPGAGRFGRGPGRSARGLIT